MLETMVYEPKDDEIFYHYCSADTFLALCKWKKLRFSDLFSMNDYLEIHWGYQNWIKVANILLKDFGEEFIDKIDKLYGAAGLMHLSTASCFSLKGDLLSQWRAYADDGKGYCIGFRASDLVKMSVTPLKVVYDEKEQIDTVTGMVKVIHLLDSWRSVENPQQFLHDCLGIIFGSAAYKNPTFSEESEVRLIHLLDFEKSNNFLKLTDAGGTSFGEEHPGEEVQYRLGQNIPIPFIDMDFTNRGKVSPIVEVIVGPKNESSLTNISIFLETMGIGGVTVKKSVSPYR
jgi:hypothetical protein